MIYFWTDARPLGILNRIWKNEECCRNLIGSMIGSITGEKFPRIEPISARYISATNTSHILRNITALSIVVLYITAGRSFRDVRKTWTSFHLEEPQDIFPSKLAFSSCLFLAFVKIKFLSIKLISLVFTSSNSLDGFTHAVARISNLSSRTFYLTLQAVNSNWHLDFTILEYLIYREKASLILYFSQFLVVKLWKLLQFKILNARTRRC